MCDSKKGRISAALLVELLGIEPATKSSVTARTRKLTTRNDAKVRETTCGHAKDVDGINMRSATPHADRQTTRYPSILHTFPSTGHMHGEGALKPPDGAASKRLSSAVPGCFLSELHPRGQAEFGVDVGEVGLHGAR
jgi:hypothetical protein